MKEIPVGDKGHVALVDDDDFEYLSRYQWGLNKGYASAYVDGKTRRMHQTLIHCPDGLLPDHRNRNKLDNQRANFRFATPLQNSVNNGLRKDNASGFKGVTWNKQCSRWKAQIRDAGKRLFLGYFHDAAEAAKAYDKKAKELFGEFAFLNFADETVSPSNR